MCSEGQPDTVADGLRTCLGSNTFPIVRDCVDAIVCVTEDEIRGAVRLVWERMKLVRADCMGRHLVVAPCAACYRWCLFAGGKIVDCFS